MDDVRFQWIRDRIYTALDIKELEVFEEFIIRDDGENEMKLAKFMNSSDDDNENLALIFDKESTEEEIEVQIELCKYCHNHKAKSIILILQDLFLF
jgi:hypothetical protein